jgi:trans-aconitate methyltransferase
VKVKSAEEWRGETAQLLEELREFASVLRTEPFANREGLRGVSAFALWWYLRQLSPTLVFEVGVWRGYSTWLIEQAAPQAEIVCLDPLVAVQPKLKRASRMGHRSTHATYSAQDFSCMPVADIAAGHERSVAFFDDHQNKLPRLLQARAAGIRDVVFDDNTPERLTHETLEEARLDPDSAATLEALVQTYETFPALWAVDTTIGSVRLKEDGLGLPVEKVFANVHAERDWHSYVTYVRLR